LLLWRWNHLISWQQSRQAWFLLSIWIRFGLHLWIDLIRYLLSCRHKQQLAQNASSQPVTKGVFGWFLSVHREPHPALAYNQMNPYPLWYGVYPGECSFGWSCTPPGCIPAMPMPTHTYELHQYLTIIIYGLIRFCTFCFVAFPSLNCKSSMRLCSIYSFKWMSGQITLHDHYLQWPKH
jgi:hypothetical protein